MMQSKTFPIIFLKKLLVILLFPFIFITPVEATNTTLSPVSFGYAQFLSRGSNFSWESLMNNNPNILYSYGAPQAFFQQGSIQWTYEGFRRGFFCFDTSAVPKTEQVKSINLSGVNKCLNINCQNFPPIEHEPKFIDLYYPVNYETELRRVNFRNLIGINSPYLSIGNMGAYNTQIDESWIKYSKQCFAIISHADYSIIQPTYWNTLHNTYSVEFDSNPVLTIVTEPAPTPMPTPVPGDANNDSTVDENDFIVWVQNFQLDVFGPANGDFNNDGAVDGVDYITWLTNYGN